MPNVEIAQSDDEVIYPKYSEVISNSIPLDGSFVHKSILTLFVLLKILQIDTPKIDVWFIKKKMFCNTWN